MEPGFTVDCEGLPVVVLTIVGAPPLNELEAALQVFERLLHDRVEYILVIDAANMGVAAAALRHHAAKWLIQYGVDVAKYCAGVVCVATSPLARAALMAMEWLDPRGQKYMMLPTREEAIEAAKRRMASAASLP